MFLRPFEAIAGYDAWMRAMTSLDAIASPEAILQALPAHIAVIDAEGRIVQVNDAWRRFAAANGLAPERCGPGADYLRACSMASGPGAAEAEAVHRGLLDVLAGRRESFSTEYPCHSPGERRWFSMTITPLAGTPPQGAVVMHVDITARRLAEEALREKATLLRTAQRIAGMGYWQVDPASWKLVLSEEAGEILAAGDARPPAHYAEFIQRVHPDDRGLVDLQLRAVMNGGAPLALPHRVLRADGAVRWLRVRAELQETADTPMRLYGTMMDITERREAGEALRHSEARHRRSAQELENILDSSVDMICTLDILGRVVRMSAACRRILGFTPDELVGRRLADLLLAEDVARSEEATEAIRRGSPVVAFENRLRRKDGSVVHLSWSARWSAADGTMYCVGRDVSEAKLIAEANRQLAERLHETLETMADAFIMLDRDWRIRYLNRVAEKAVGIPREQLAGRRIDHVFPDPDAEPFMRQYGIAFETNQPVVFQASYPPLGLHLEARALPTPDGLAIYFRDYTERHRAQQALAESEERFKRVAEATTDATWDWNVVSGEIWLSEGVERLFGIAPGADNLQCWANAIHADDRQRVVSGVMKALQGSEVLWAARYRLRRREGGYAEVLDRGYIMRDASGKAMRMVGGLNDLTEQLEAENRLREQARLLDAARDAIHMRDMEHRVLYWNRGAEKLFGWKAEEVAGTSVETLLHHDPEPFRGAMAILLRRGEWAGELETIHRDGRRHIVEGRWTLLRDAQGEPSRILCIDTDVTERRQLERQLIRVQRVESIGTLAGGIAHDLNNVLTPILMSANLLQRPDRDPEEQELITAISRSAQRGADMITQLLSFARGVEGQQAPFDLAAVVRDVRKIVAETFPRHIEINTRVEGGLWTVHGDATQLHQVLLNLCVNARDAMPDGGSLTIEARNERLDAQLAGADADSPDTPYVVLAVQDTGIGMSEEVLEKIFDPFFTTKDVGKGTGLGLATSLSIVQRHRGFIRVASRPGEGARFTIWLPAVEATLLPAPEDAMPLPRGEGQTVLLVDDEAPIRQVAEQMLRAYGYQVVAAADGAEALALYAKLRRTISVALVDMMMPLMDGPATIQALRRINPWLPVVATSGIADDSNVQRAQAAGALALVPKPYTAERLLPELSRALAPRTAATIGAGGAAGPS